ncbi:MAG: cupin domain-containing protein [Sphingomonadales bacterium]|nr:MAG: cupin domain-containing protein [Sphingomonadales bacterium]
MPRASPNPKSSPRPCAGVHRAARDGRSPQAPSLAAPWIPAQGRDDRISRRPALAHPRHASHPPLMRILLLSPLLLAAAPMLGQDSLPPPPDLRFDIPANAAPQQVQLRGGNYAPGEGVALHVHPGVEMAYVVAGTVEFRMGDTVVIKRAGDTNLIPRGTPHAAKNIGTDTARIVSAFVIDQGAQLRVPVGADGKPLP